MLRTRYRIVAWVMAAAALAGCVTVTSTEPMYDRASREFDPALLGEWHGIMQTAEGDVPIVCQLDAAGDFAYQLSLHTGGVEPQESWLTNADLVRFGHQLFIVPWVGVAEIVGDPMVWPTILIRCDDSSLVLCWLNGVDLLDAVESDPEAVPHEIKPTIYGIDANGQHQVIIGTLTLRSSTTDIATLLASHAHDDSIFVPIATLHR